MRQNPKETLVHTLTLGFLLMNVAGVAVMSLSMVIYFYLECEANFFLGILPVCTKTEDGWRHATTWWSPTHHFYAFLQLLAHSDASNFSFNYTILVIVFTQYRATATLQAFKPPNVRQWIREHNTVNVFGAQLNDTLQAWTPQILFWTTIISIISKFVAIHLKMGVVLTTISFFVATMTMGFVIFFTYIPSKTVISSSLSIRRRHNQALLSRTNYLAKLLRACQPPCMKVGSFGSLDSEALVTLVYKNLEYTVALLALATVYERIG